MVKIDEKRKRSAKTSYAQYEEYLRTMEVDQIFRSGTINPTVDQNYVSKKWESLAQKLNSLGSGPSLSTDEWRKRFNDWKHSTRSKYRKMVESSKRTGGGPCLDISLTPLEDRGLTVWGKVAVTGTPKVLVVGGLQAAEEQAGTSTTSSITRYVISPDLSQDADVDRIENEEPTASCINEEDQNRESKKRTLTILDKRLHNKKRIQNNFASTSRPVSDISEEFLTLYKNDILKGENVNENLLKQKLKLERDKLRFEVAKYKFENPGFEFELDDVDCD